MPDTLTPAEEIAALRTTNTELLAKSRDRKAKLTAAEATIVELNGKLTTAETALRAATIDRPLKAMAETLSPVPQVFLTELAKHYKVELNDDGNLTLLTLDGKPVLDADKEVPFEAQAISKLLTAGNNEDLASFPHLVYGSMASGGGASPSPGSQVQYPDKQTGKQPDRPQFGLR